MTRPVRPAGTGAVSLRRLAWVVFPAAAVAVCVNLGIRAIAVSHLGVPPQALPLAGLVIGSVMPVFGPAFGCLLAFRRPDGSSMRKFVLPSAAFVLLGILIEAGRYAAGHGHGRAFVAGASQGLISTGLALPLLLRVVVRPALAGGHAPTRSGSSGAS